MSFFPQTQVLKDLGDLDRFRAVAEKLGIINYCLVTKAPILTCERAAKEASPITGSINRRIHSILVFNHHRPSCFLPPHTQVEN